MWKKLKDLARARPTSLAIFSLALAVTLWFAVRLTYSTVYWNDPLHQNQALEPWMTPRYIQMSYALKPETVAEILGLERPFPRRTRVRDIADDLGVSLEELTQQLRAAADLAQAEREARGGE